MGYLSFVYTYYTLGRELIADGANIHNIYSALTCDAAGDGKGLKDKKNRLHFWCKGGADKWTDGGTSGRRFFSCPMGECDWVGENWEN